MEGVRKIFNDLCEKLGIKNWEEEIKRLVVYLMTDGTRTSSMLPEKEAYMDGSKFVVRFLTFLRKLGSKSCWVNVFEEFHQERGNYPQIYSALLEVVPFWREFAMKNNMRLKFVGKLDEPINPAGINEDLRVYLKELEELTEKNEFETYILINFSREWAEKHRDFFKDFPTINAVIRFTKGVGVPEFMWPPGKIRYESLIYVQQGSSSINWSDRQLLFLIALALRAVVRNTPFYARKEYKPGERERIRKLREEEAIFVNKDFYDEELDEGKKPKVAVIFTEVGPERYKF